ncbi:A/G-specific adenine glycosylase [Bacteroides sedimenti]|uniref:Adenine DNA glycosylase n=1 Tax=Bacteroides sedimenti TaxID=2136147 RepID=A0ABM8I9V1_9BACE
MSDFSNKLIDWYSVNKRALPWRETTDPYLIWISEIILQQTRVVQGYDYFIRFVERFPTVKSLAEADEDEVMKYWQGLGYYSRARNLHTAAKSILGDFPKSYDEILSLKGVGEYTASAICSFAYNLPYAVVDGNVYRVLSRYLGIDTPIDSTQGKKLFASLAAELLDKSNPGIYNQAIMDFGAIQCIPSSPDCNVCPLVDSCIAFAEKLTRVLPVKQGKTKSSNRYFNYIYVRMGAYTFINKRSGNDIWKNLFELPLIETEHLLSEEEFYALPQFQQLFTSGEEPMIRCLERNVKHVLSHRIIITNFYEVVLSEHSKSFSNYKKVAIKDIDQFAVSRLIHLFLEKYL